MIYAKQVLNSKMNYQINYFKWYWLQLLKKMFFNLPTTNLSNAGFKVLKDN